MSEIPVSLAMICRDHYAELERCLVSIHKHVDEIVVAMDTRTEKPELIEKICETYGAKCLPYAWDTDSFADARNFAQDNCTHDWVLWLDADDEVKNAEAMMRDFREWISKGKYDIVVVPYFYAFDAQSGVNSCYLERERIYNRNHLRWRGEVHETCRDANKEIYELRADHDTKFDWQIIHHEVKDTTTGRYERVYTRLKKKYADDPGSLDTRDLYYLAVSSNGMKKFEEARKWYKATVEKAPGPQDQFVFLATVALGDLWFNESNYPEAMQEYRRLTEMYPFEGLGWARMAECYRYLGNTKMAVETGKVALESRRDYMHLSQDPRSYTLYPARTVGLSAADYEDFDTAKEYLEKALQYDPTDAATKHGLANLSNIGKGDEVFKAFQTLREELEKEGDHEALGSLERAVPRAILGHTSFSGLTHIDLSEHPKAITFINLQQGAPLYNDMREVGCGGAEEMALTICRGLAERGYHVNLYTSIQEPTWREDFGDGVMQVLPVQHLREDLEHGTVIAWRHPSAGKNLKCRQRIFWDNDFSMQDASEYEGLDAHIFVSKAHERAFRETWTQRFNRVYGVPTKVINPPVVRQEFTCDPWFRDPTRMFYTSRFERGMHNVLKVFGKVAEQRPEASLYLFTQIDDLHNKQMLHNPGYKKDFIEYQDLLQEYIRRGYKIYGHAGSTTGQGTLASFLPTAGVFLYPSAFAETFCISAAKAQLSGCIPVCNTFAGLETTVHPDFREVHDPDDIDFWAAKAIEAMDVAWDDPVRKDLARHASEFCLGPVLNKLEDSLLVTVVN